MTAYLGTSMVKIQQLINPSNLSGDISAVDKTLGILRLVRGISINSGLRTIQVPTVMPKLARIGDSIPCTDQEFAGDITIWPYTIDMGLVLTAQVYTLGVWNLTGRAQYMVNWLVVGIDGVALTNLEGYPIWYGPTQYREYRLDVAVQGQAEINGTITVNFTGFAGLVTTITGLRLITFSFEPNWREPVIESLEWLTDVLTSHSGKEQRIALRTNPRRAIKYLYTLDYQNKVSNFESYLWGWQHRVFAVPVWTDWIRPTTLIPTGAMTINVVTSLRDFANTRLAIIWRDFLNYEVVEIQSLTASTLVLAKATIYNWEITDRIIPVRLARLDKTISIDRPTSNIAEASVTFTMEPITATDTTRLGTSIWQQYQGLDVLNVPVNSTEKVSEEYTREMVVFDNKKGSWNTLTLSDGPTAVRPYSWLLKTRQEIMNFLAFLEVHKGKQVPFWMPTWSKDIELMQNISSSDTTILIKKINYTKMIDVHPNRRDLAFYPTNSSLIPIVKRITSCVEVTGGNELLTIDTSFGVAKLITDFRAISFLTLGRFDQDNFELTWRSDSIMEVSTSIREVLQ
jgi:hypothetical protein